MEVEPSAPLLHRTVFSPTSVKVHRASCDLKLVFSLPCWSWSMCWCKGLSVITNSLLFRSWGFSFAVSWTLLLPGTEAWGREISSRDGCAFPVFITPLSVVFPLAVSSKSPESKYFLSFSCHSKLISISSIGLTWDLCRNAIPPGPLPYNGEMRLAVSSDGRSLNELLAYFFSLQRSKSRLHRTSSL